MLKYLDAVGETPTGRYLRTMFEDRKRVFVDRCGWELPVTDCGLEHDQYDGIDARYLGLVGADDAHLASLRLVPTTRPHLLDEHFGYLCECAPPTGPGIFEVTRFCLTPSVPAAQRRMLRTCLISHLVDRCVADGIHMLTGITSAGFLAQLLEMGWRCERLGPEAALASGKVGAFKISFDSDTARQLSERGEYIPPTERDAIGKAYPEAGFLKLELGQ
ncbi:acyl-homoserine-lactone synthase [Sphingomonas colocasiae]|uniref:Acyl-homoserine-lactone synthase n=1 Tax=Sphingomonas colocasiae TaxID=1848973 RepID=A0ABS7PID1_9SPHN|nr:acyl-homoserine-lactone synthase [Sphingomonas colocasiae]MBY8821060.1 autoinducer synthase [Sphingomonas colocasiae]